MGLDGKFKLLLILRLDHTNSIQFAVTNLVPNKMLTSVLLMISIYLFFMGLYYRHLAIISKDYGDQKAAEKSRDEKFVGFIILISLTATTYLLSK